jgi:hypothetical protein
MFKSKGYDGIVYKSLLDDEGFNTVLFNSDNAKLLNTLFHKFSDVFLGATRDGMTRASSASEDASCPGKVHT